MIKVDVSHAIAHFEHRTGLLEGYGLVDAFKLLL